MSERIIQSFSEMKNIYLTQIVKEDKDNGEDYEDKYKKTGKKSKDYDEDGEVEDEADEYAGVKDKAIKKAKTHKKDKDEDEEYKMKAESYSDWRSDLFEIVSKLEPKMKDVNNDEIKEKPVKNKIIVNPSVSENISFINGEELNEEFITESVNITANYLYEMGLNEHGLDLVLETLDEDTFLEYIFHISDDYMLTEARRSGRIEPVTKTGKPIATLRGGAKASAIRSRKKEKSSRDVEDTRPSGMTAALKRQADVAKKVTMDRGNSAVKAAVEAQPKTKQKSNETKDKIARGILGFISGAQKQYAKGMERHKAAMKMASQTAEVGSNVAKAVSKGAKAVGGGITSGVRVATGLETPSGKETKLGRTVAAATYKGARNVTRAARDAYAKEVGYRRARAQTNENVQYILEKAVSEQQQKIFGLALSVKRGMVSRDKVSDKVLEIADGMSEAEIRKFATTKHKGIPKKA